MIDRLQIDLHVKIQILRATHGDAPVYLLEHGLGDSDLAKLFGATRDCLSEHGLDADWWSTRPLPLLVAATEVGYEYRGTGTNFWPIFANRFGVTSQVDRGALSGLFRHVAKSQNLAQPADTPWNRAFCHIAWPVLHAVLPVELHLPLARSLREVRSRLDVEADDAVLIAPFRARAQLAGGVRLLAWFEEQHTAATVIRFFLNPTGATAIEQAALARIAADLARDETANAALRDARKRQKALEAKPTWRTRRRSSEVQIRFAPLVLRQLDPHWLLAIKIPQMEQTPRVTARDALEAIRWPALLWSQGRPVPSRSLFSNFPVPIAVNHLPSTETPLLGGLATLPLSQDAKDFLGSLRVQTSAPLLFGDADAGGDFVQLLSNAVTDNGHYIVLVTPEQPAPPPCAGNLGRVAGMRAFRINAADLDTAAWLGQLGISVRQSECFRWLGVPEVEQHRPTRRFLRDSFLAFELSTVGRSCEARLIDPKGSESALCGHGRLLCGFTPDTVGTYAIRYGANEMMVFEIVEEVDDEPVLGIGIDAGASSIADLSGRGVTLRFDSAAALQEADLELHLLCDGRLVGSALEILPDTPCKIGADHVIWDELLSEETLERLLASNIAELVVSVRGLAKEYFLFEQVMAPFGWERDAKGNLSAIDETGKLALFTVSPSEPLRVVAGVRSDGDHDIVLLRAGHDGPLQFGGLCFGPKIWRLSETEAADHPERLLRQFDIGRDGVADGRSLTDALIAWSAAGVDNLVAQFRRGQIVKQLEQWLVEQVCGAEWARRESALASHRMGRFAERFLDACVRLGVGFADLALSAAQRALLRRILLRLLDSRGLSIQLELTHEPIDDDLAAELDGLFNDGYAALAKEIVAVGDRCPFDPDEDVDVGEASDRWDGALRAAAQTGFVDLVDLLRPLEAGDTLHRADFESLLPDDVIILMTAWIARHRPAHQARIWNRDLVEAAYWLFAKPAVAARLSWREASQRLLADSFSARAIRYAALRSGGLV